MGRAEGALSWVQIPSAALLAPNLPTFPLSYSGKDLMKVGTGEGEGIKELQIKGTKGLAERSAGVVQELLGKRV